MSKTLISVIIPVYNAEKYLHKCVTSILSQTFTDFELLLINDGSNDLSGKICDEYATKESCIHVFHKENGGASSARNLGIDKAKGEWIVFVDSDDWVEPDYLEVLYDHIEDGFVASAYSYEKDGKKWQDPLEDKTITISANNLTNILMSAIFMAPNSKLYKRDILNDKNIRFNCQLTAKEDTLFIWSYLLHVNRIRTIRKATYHYCITGDGLSHKRIPIEECTYALNCFKNVLAEFQQKYTDFDLQVRHIWLVDEMFKKAVTEEVCETTCFQERKEKLHKLLQNESVSELLKDKIVMPKGVKRKIWDYLSLNHISLLVLYTYFYKYD